MAAAEVTFSGLGRFGVHYNEANNDNPQGDTNLTSRLRLNASMSTQSDAGIELGGYLRIQYDHGTGTLCARKAGVTTGPAVRDFNSNGECDTDYMKAGEQKSASWSGGRLYAKMGPAKIEVGNVSDAIDSMPGLYLPTTSVGTGLNYMDPGMVALNSFRGFSSSGAGVVNGVNFVYSMGDLSLLVNSNDGAKANDSDDHLSAYIAYKVNGWQIALAGLDSQDDKNIVVGTVKGDLGFAGVGLSYANNENAGGTAADPDDVGKVRLYGHVPVGMATEVVVWGANQSDPLAGSTADGGSFGIDVEHHLGGGVTAVAGVSDSVGDNATQASAGIFFKF